MLRLTNVINFDHSRETEESFRIRVYDPNQRLQTLSNQIIPFASLPAHFLSLAHTSQSLQVQAVQNFSITLALQNSLSADNSMLRVKFPEDYVLEEAEESPCEFQSRIWVQGLRPSCLCSIHDNTLEVTQLFESAPPPNTSVTLSLQLANPPTNRSRPAIRVQALENSTLLIEESEIPLAFAPEVIQVLELEVLQNSSRTVSEPATYRL